MTFLKNSWNRLTSSRLGKYFYTLGVLIGEVFSFSYKVVDEDEVDPNKAKRVYECRSIIEWYIMLVGDFIAIGTATLVILILVDFAGPDIQFLNVLDYLVPAQESAMDALTGKVVDHPLSLAMKRLTHLGLLVLATNAILEIGLLIEEPGVRHVRRVLALAFTGMTLYLTKEYALGKSDETNFLLGCLAGLLAAFMWILGPLSQKLRAH